MIEFDLPARNLLFFVQRKRLPGLRQVHDSVLQALRRPLGVTSLKQVANKRRRKVVVLVDDLTRPTPQEEVLPPVLDQLCSLGVEQERIQVVVASGSHRSMTDGEVRDHLGAQVVEEFEVCIHDYKDDQEHVYLGMSELGIPVIVNKIVAQADLVVSVGNIAPHNAVGWGGGAKMILPGVSGERSIGALHVLAGKIKPNRKLIATVDNPIRRDIESIAGKVGLRLVVNTVLNSQDRVVRVVAGEPVRSFREGVGIARQVFCQSVPELADVVICSSNPAHIDYWQALKPLSFAHVAVREGGTIVLATPCPERISATHPSLKAHATKSYTQLLEAIERNEIDDAVAAGALLIHSQVLEDASVICYSSGLTEEDKRSLGFEHASSIEEAIRAALKRHGKGARVGVLECGEVVPVPIVATV
jgi:nickel-dependent lactate racemase